MIDNRMILSLAKKGIIWNAPKSEKIVEFQENRQSKKLIFFLAAAVLIAVGIWVYNLNDKPEVVKNDDENTNESVENIKDEHENFFGDQSVVEPKKINKPTEVRPVSYYQKLYDNKDLSEDEALEIMEMLKKQIQSVESEDIIQLSWLLYRFEERFGDRSRALDGVLRHAILLENNPKAKDGFEDAAGMLMDEALRIYHYDKQFSMEFHEILISRYDESYRAFHSYKKLGDYFFRYRLNYKEAIKYYKYSLLSCKMNTRFSRKLNEETVDTLSACYFNIEDYENSVACLRNYGIQNDNRDYMALSLLREAKCKICLGEQGFPIALNILKELKELYPEYEPDAEFLEKDIMQLILNQKEK